MDDDGRNGDRPSRTHPPRGPTCSVGMLRYPHQVRILQSVRTWFSLLLLVCLNAGGLVASGPAQASAENGQAVVELPLACQTDSTESADEDCCDYCGHVCCLPGVVTTVSSAATIAPPQLIIAPTTALRERPVPVLLEPPRPTLLR